MSPEEHAEPDADWESCYTERLAALGEIVEHSATMEWKVREAFCALLGSKYAAIVAAGQNMTWLIDQSRALTEARHDIPDEHRHALKTALDRCRAANERRNPLVHGIKTASNLDGSFQTIRSRSRKHTPDIQPWALADIRAAAHELLFAGLALTSAVINAVGPVVAAISDTLAWEERRRQEAGDMRE